MPRKYEKKSEYWNTFHGAKGQLETNGQSPTWKPSLVGDSYYTHSSNNIGHLSRASITSRTNNSGGDDQSQTSRINNSALEMTYDRFSAIRQGLLPFQYSRDGVSIREAILLCQKAYANVAIFTRTIDLLSEMSNTEVYLEGGTKKSRAFFSAWFEKICLDKVKSQYFREYFRSGNLFHYRIDGKFTAEDYSKLIQTYASEGGVQENTIPLRYILLNPYDVVAKAATAFSMGDYEKILSQYELTKLKNPQTEEDREIFQGLPEAAKDLITKKAWQRDGIRIKLPAEKIIFSFRKKSDYEPFAVPFGYPVLEDINAKLEMKKMDQAILRTVENVILLITMGAKPDEGGINPANIAAIQQIFQNGTTGRTLVSDWTTKAEFIIPDLKKVLGPEKYQILDADIREGLQNILLGEEKYGNTQTKVEIFLEGLKEARNIFLMEFLQPEIRRIAKSLGFRSFPQAKMKEVDAKDPTQAQRIITRMIELGILDPETAIHSMRTNTLPDPDSVDLVERQTEYIKQRKAGNWMPLAPVPIVAQPAPKLDPNVKYPVDNAPPPTAPSSGKKGGNPKKPKTMKSGGRPSGSKASVVELQSVTYATEDLLSFIKEGLKTKHNLSQLSDAQLDVANNLSQSIVCAARKDEWETLAAECLADEKRMLNLDVMPEILEVSAENDLDVYAAALYYHAGE